MDFFARGAVEDVDSTTSDEPMHPSTVLLVDFGNVVRRVVLPPDLAAKLFTDLAVGTVVRITGRIVPGMTFVATELRR